AAAMRSASSCASSLGWRPAAFAEVSATLLEKSPCSRRAGCSRWIVSGGWMPACSSGALSALASSARMVNWSGFGGSVEGCYRPPARGPKPVRRPHALAKGRGRRWYSAWPRPRSSGDRASASGAVCAGSNPAEGTWLGTPVVARIPHPRGPAAGVGSHGRAASAVEVAVLVDEPAEAGARGPELLRGALLRGRDRPVGVLGRDQSVGGEHHRVPDLLGRGAPHLLQGVEDDVGVGGPVGAIERLHRRAELLDPGRRALGVVGPAARTGEQRG